MLHFSGLEYKRGIPSNFFIKIELLAAIKDLSNLLKKNSMDAVAVKGYLRAELETLYKMKKNDTKRIAAYIYLKLNIVEFLIAEEANKEYFFKLLYFLQSEASVKEKWDNVLKLTLQSLIKGLSKEAVTKMLYSYSSLQKALKICRLVFLDQSPELPPANIKLEFIPNSFPDHNWVSSELNNFIVNQNWEVADIYCNLNYLQQEVLQKITNKNLIAADLKPEKINIGAFKKPSKLIIKYAADKKSTDQLISEKAWQSLQSIQELLLKKYKNKGLLGFYAILYTLAQNKNSKFKAIFAKDISRLYNLKNNSQKNSVWKLIQSIIADLSQVEVYRYYESESVYSKNALLQVWSEIKSETDSESNGIVLVMDDLFIDNPANESYSIAAPFLLFDIKLFSLNISADLKELPKVYAYLCSSWQANENNSIIKDAKSLIYESNLSLTTKSKYRPVYKLLAYLRYLKDQNLISEYRLLDNENKNPLTNTYAITANEVSSNLIKNFKEINNLSLN